MEYCLKNKAEPCFKDSLLHTDNTDDEGSALFLATAMEYCLKNKAEPCFKDSLLLTDNTDDEGSALFLATAPEPCFKDLGYVVKDVDMR